MYPDTARAQMTHSAFKMAFADAVHDTDWPDNDKGNDKRPKSFVPPAQAPTHAAATVTSATAGSSAHVSSMTKRKQGEDGDSTTKRRKK